MANVPESFHIDADLTGAGEFLEGSPGLALGNTLACGVPGIVSHIRWRSPALASGGTITGGLYEVVASDPPTSSTPGTLLKSATFGAITDDAWNTVVLPTGGQAIVPGVAYRPAVQGAPTMRYRGRGSFHQLGITRNNLYSHADNTGLFGHTNLRNGTFFTTGTLAYPRDNFNATAYFVDVVFIPDYYHMRPWRIPALTSAAGRYSFGLDVTSTDPIRFTGVRWYHPPGGTKGDVNVYLDATSAPGVHLASGGMLGTSLVDGWNIIPYNVPYTGAPSTVYSPYIDLVGNGDHAYDNSVTIPQTDASGRVTMTHTRYESGGGFPVTQWDGGWHGVDAQYDFNTAAPPVGQQERWGMFI